MRIASATALVLALLVLGGCSAPSAEQPFPSPTPVAGKAAGPVIIAQSAELMPVRQQVPPVRVVVASVGIDIEVRPVGVQPDGLMELPENIRVAGWYKYGPDPASETGSTVVSAHVDSFEQGLGPFASLKSAAIGSEVIVVGADGVEYRYTVESVQNVAKDQLPLDQVFDREGMPRLVLITCGGQFDQSVLNYSDNVVVVATPVVQ